MEKKFQSLSKKQVQVLTWWKNERLADVFDAIICDGAIRSGKTLSMSLSFVLWAMMTYDAQNFAICGKTVSSCRRNVIDPLLPILTGLSMRCHASFSQNYVDVKWGEKQNRLYLFGGKDESSQSLIQGITLAGVLLDEVALMPRSFVEQALARCSVAGSKFWFNCNPEGPQHWFYKEWILRHGEKRALYLHFTMEDNPALPLKTRERYERLYDGVFYDRYIKGQWVQAEGLIYPMFDAKRHVVDSIPEGAGFNYVSVDYGTVNAFAAGFWGIRGGVAYKEKEYYYSGRTDQRKTDEEYYAELDTLIGDAPLEYIIVDPSAASFIECIIRHGKYRVRKGANEVVSGIRTMSSLLQADRLRYHKSCLNTIREFALYRWDEKKEKDSVIKENDHTMDSDRYFCHTVLRREFGWMDWSKKAVVY